jgi:hypothetical protein
VDLGGRESTAHDEIERAGEGNVGKGLKVKTAGESATFIDVRLARACTLPDPKAEYRDNSLHVLFFLTTNHVLYPYSLNFH